MLLLPEPMTATGAHGSALSWVSAPTVTSHWQQLDIYISIYLHISTLTPDPALLHRSPQLYSVLCPGRQPGHQLRAKAIVRRVIAEGINLCLFLMWRLDSYCHFVKNRRAAQPLHYSNTRSYKSSLLQQGLWHWQWQNDFKECKRTLNSAFIQNEWISNVVHGYI